MQYARNLKSVVYSCNPKRLTITRRSEDVSVEKEKRIETDFRILIDETFHCSDYSFFPLILSVWVQRIAVTLWKYCTVLFSVMSISDSQKRNFNAILRSTSEDSILFSPYFFLEMKKFMNNVWIIYYCSLHLFRWLTEQQFWGFFICVFQNFDRFY